MLKRKIISKLEFWVKNHNHEALLIKGARQVGKTTTIREFARVHYAHLVEINFELNPEAKDAFSGSLDAENIYRRLSLLGYGPFIPGKTLLFLDEIQSCPNARTAIKFLVEDGRIDVIESGSLLGINYADVSSYPVGYESQIEMFPLDFEEWLWANNIVIDFNQKIDEFTHNQLMKQYRAFLIVGGMPKVVTTYLSNPDFAETLRQQRILIDSYRLDIAKYAGSEKTKAKRFFDAIPSQLSKAHKRYIFRDLEQTGNMQKYADAAQWLEDAGIAYFCYNTHTLNLPIEQYENRNLFKVYLLDTGLLCAMWKDPIQQKVMSGEVDVNEGALTENFVANELVKRGANLHYYDHKGKDELDFIIPNNKAVTILEVKSGNNYKKHAALDNVLDRQHEYIDKAIVLNKFMPEQIEDITYLPLYMVAKA